MEVCTVCGLPKNLCVCEEIEREERKIKIRSTRTRFGKWLTAISGFETQESAEQLEKTLKKRLACGGTTKEKVIELQGDHRKKVKGILLSMGYKEGLIDG